MGALGIGQTDLGKNREQNEDHLLVDNELGVYIVCDGMGGHAAGEVASRTAIETTHEAMRQQRPLIEQVGKGEAHVHELVRASELAVQQACREVHRLATSQRQYSGMGCTLTMVVMAENQCVMAHVGDTRLYLARGGEAHQLSTDHTMAAELFRMGSITAEEVTGHRYANVLTRAIGPQASVQVDTLSWELAPGDRLLLCSDGLSEYVESNDWLAKQLAGSELEPIPDQLIDFANASGGHDNITALVVDVGVEKEQEKDGAQSLHPALQLLSTFVLFEDLSLAQLTRVLHATTTTQYDASAQVVAEGTSLDSLYIVLDGRLTLETRGPETVQLERGQYFGESTLMHPRRARATVHANGAATVLRLQRDRLLELMSRRPWLGVELLGRLAKLLGRQLDALHSGDQGPGERWC